MHNDKVAVPMSVVAFEKAVRVCRAALVALAVLSVGACASQSTPDEIAHVQETNDPYEPMNRAIFAFNEGLDVVILKPLAVWYTFLVPFQDARDTIRRVIDNAALPWTAINEVFQGEWQRAGTSSTPPRKWTRPVISSASVSRCKVSAYAASSGRPASRR